MNFRLQEGNGVMMYRLGVEDDGNPIGLGDVDLAHSIKTVRTTAGVLGERFPVYVGCD